VAEWQPSWISVILLQISLKASKKSYFRLHNGRLHQVTPMPCCWWMSVKINDSKSLGDWSPWLRSAICWGFSGYYITAAVPRFGRILAVFWCFASSQAGLQCCVPHPLPWLTSTDTCTHNFHNTVIDCCDLCVVTACC